MKKFAAVVLTCLLSVPVFASESPWLTSLPEAEAQAKAEHKLIFANFTGSDWCPPCKKMESDTFSKPEFLDYAKKNYVLLVVDFPIDKPQSKELKKANDELQSKYDVQGYPTLAAITADGTIVWKHVGYLDGGPLSLISKLDEVKKKSG